MNNDLYIFVGNIRHSSMNLYMNIISHAVRHLSVTKLFFVQITGYEGIMEIKKEDMSSYINWDLYNEVKQRKSANAEFYEEIYNVFTNNKKVVQWSYLLLNQYIKNINENTKNSLPLIDLSSLPKIISMDLFIRFISLGIDNLFIFELKDPNNNNKKLPYHELLKTDFKVIKIVSEDVFKYTFEKYTQKLNRNKLIVVLFSIIISVVLVLIFPPSRQLVVNNIILILTLFSGLLPLLELAGYINLSNILGRLRK